MPRKPDGTVPMRALTFDCPEDLRRDLLTYVEDTQVPQARVIRMALKAYLAGKKEGRKAK